MEETFDDFWKAMYERNQQQKVSREIRVVARNAKNILDTFMNEGFTREEAFEVTLQVIVANLHCAMYEEDE